MSRKSYLKDKILRHILLNGRTTRPELVSATNGRAATVFEAIDELKAVGILCEPGRKGKKTGRRAPELDCSPDYCHCVGIEFRNSVVLGVVVDTTGSVLYQYEISLPQHRNVSNSRREILTLLQKLRDFAGDNWKFVKAIGFADPGLVDTEKNLSLRAVSVPGWENLATGEWLQNVSGIHAGVWPEAMVRTRMEYLQKFPVVPDSLFYLGTDDGIGGGFIKEGKLFVGATHRGMEIGHVVVRSDGPVCQCGNRGCLEALAGKHGIANRIKNARDNGINISLNPDDFTIPEFVDIVHSDKCARMIADEICVDIGGALAVVVSLLNPEVIVISGELSALGDRLLDAVRRQLELKCFPGAIKNLRLEISQLDRFATAHGSALLMRDRFLLEMNKDNMN